MIVMYHGIFAENIIIIIRKVDNGYSVDACSSGLMIDNFHDQISFLFVGCSQETWLRLQ